MPQINLSTLPAQELRQLLDSARQRGLAAQSYEILQEMEARRMSGEPKPLKRSRRRRSPDARVIVLDLGDPLDPAPEPEEVFASDEPPLTLGEPPLRGADTPPPAARVRQRWGHWATLCFALGLGGGVATGWWAADGGQWERPALPASGVAAAPPAKRPLPVIVAAAAAPDLAKAPSTATTPPEAAQPAATGPAAQVGEGVPAAATQQMASAAPAPAKVEAVSDADRGEANATGEAGKHSLASDAPGCGGEPTPADRTICGEPGLRRLQTQLRQAYAAALEAHEDRALLRQRELAWRDGRNAVSDPEQLAGLYKKRISQLKAAAADAERQRGSASHGSRPRQASTVGRSLGA